MVWAAQIDEKTVAHRAATRHLDLKVMGNLEFETMLPV
jgi:hypothetical protein